MASLHPSKNGDFTSNSRDSVSQKQENRVTGVEETLDRINQLPDALLVQILSLLPTRDAVASSVLSKRWRYLWNSIDNFHFVVRNDDRAENFISFVDHVLAHCTCPKIRKFKLDLNDMSNREFELIISLWISFAVERNVEDVVFLCSFDDLELYYKWPPLSMCTCSSLITLDWSCCTFDRKSIIEWKSLKSLKLQYILFDDDDIVNLLSCCPALETMELSLFEGFRRVEITSSNLKRLTLASHKWPRSGEEDSLEIFAPHLQHLDISGALGHIKCRLVNVSSLVTASLTFDICCIVVDSVEDDIEEESCRDYHQVFRNLVLDYLQKLSYAIELTIGSWLAEVVFMLQLEGVALPELRCKCKCLTLKLQVSRHTLYGITSLLEASPLLETLNIHMEYEFVYEHCQLEQSYLAEGDNTNLLCWIPNIVFSSLKNIKIVDCIQRCVWARCSKEWSEGDFDKLIELSKFLLKNAVVLEKFVIVAKRRKCRKCSESCASQFLTRLAKTLLDSPRSSKNFVITYQESALDD